MHETRMRVSQCVSITNYYAKILLENMKFLLPPIKVFLDIVHNEWHRTHVVCMNLNQKKMSSVSYDFFCKCVLFILLINKNKTSIVLFIQRIWRANILYDVHIPWEMMARAKFTTMNQPTTHARHSRIKFENEWKFICWEKPKVLGMSCLYVNITLHYVNWYV